MKYIIYAFFGYIAWAGLLFMIPQLIGPHYGLVNFFLRLLGAIVIGAFAAKKRYQGLQTRKKEIKRAFFYFCKRDLAQTLLLVLVWLLYSGSQWQYNLLDLFWSADSAEYRYPLIAQFVYLTFFEYEGFGILLLLYCFYRIAESFQLSGISVDEEGI